MVEMVFDVRELLLHFFFEVIVEGDLGRSGLSLIGVVSVSMMDEVGELLFHFLHVVVEGELSLQTLLHADFKSNTVKVFAF
jgi:hypothetical protein